MRFDTDYIEGCHPAILTRLSETNFCKQQGYGLDEYCASARERIQNACAAPHSDVHFVTGGTQANVTVISHALRPYQGVLCAVTGHINGHETGATEARGHKVLPLPEKDAKISADQVEAYLRHYRRMEYPEHEIEPKMVYLSQPTEQGTLYSLKELNAFRSVCDRYGLYLFIDGARLGYALATPVNDVFLTDLARLTDVFYIGGTKVGAMFGEAIVIQNEDIKQQFRYSIKQNEGMLAKGRYLGLQFDTLFTDNLYTTIATNAITLADTLREALRTMGVSFFSPSPTNQVFPIFTLAQVEELEKLHVFERWNELPDGRVAIRFCTSWATQKCDLDNLISDIQRILEMV